MYNPKVLLLALNYIGIVTASLGMLIFIPQMIKSLGDFSNMTVGWLTMIPYTCGAIAMVVWGRISDRMNERRWNLFIGCVFSTVGLVIAGMTMGTWWALVGMSIAAMGFYGSKGPFFAMPPMFLSGAGLAAGIAWINSLGNLGGFFGPWYVGTMRDLTGSYAGGLYGLALLGLIAAIVCALFLHIPNRIPRVDGWRACGMIGTIKVGAGSAPPRSEVSCQRHPAGQLSTATGRRHVTPSARTSRSNTC